METTPEPSFVDKGSEATRMTERVIAAVADAEDVDPAVLSPPLFDAVDPDALNRLFMPNSPLGGTAVRRVTFAYAGYEVTVRSDGGIDVVPADR